MHCLIYARVSTDKQADKDQSIPAQLQAMCQHAEQRGWTIVGELVEAGVSGRTADCPSLRQLLKRCRDHDQPQIEIVLVHKRDRLARNLADHVAIRAQLRDRAVTIASVTESVEDSVSGQLVEHILAYGGILFGQSVRGGQERDASEDPQGWVAAQTAVTGTGSCRTATRLASFLTRYMHLWSGQRLKYA